MPIFQSIPGVNGLSKNIALDQKWKNAVFIFINASFSSCPDEIDKNEQIRNLSLTLWTRRAASSGTGDCRRQSLLPCIHVGRSCKKHSLSNSRRHSANADVIVDVKSKIIVSRRHFFSGVIFSATSKVQN